MNALTEHLAVSFSTYLMPIVAIGWGVLDGETMLPMQLLMVGVILLGVYMVNLGTRVR